LKTVFRTALEIAWADGSMSKKGALIIEKLHDAMKLENSLREKIEEEFYNEILNSRAENGERGEGKGDTELESWVNSLIDNLEDDELEKQVLYLSRRCVEIGLSKEKWLFGIKFTKEFNQSNTFAQGVWMEKNIQVEYNDFLKILEPLANVLNSN
tara:strand:+ start:491 stop:955 length:465 start_codon:yes stop_codon:yes gene_type:complete